ncbi:MAG: DUF1049 domain-containing protein [Proteobacteria bacterium]|nr:DUF1049 domain-containing protein [Pseudomonadota bacterium]
MSRIATGLLLIIAIAFSFFAYLNQETATLKLWKGQEVVLPVVLVVLAAMLLGAAVVLLIFALRGIRKTYNQIQEGMVRKRRMKAEDLYNKGVDAHLSGKMPNAVKHLKDAVSKDPGYLLPLFRLGTVYMEMGEAQKAIELHRKALDAHPDNLRILLYLVDDYLAAKQPDQAAEVLEKIIARDSSNQAAYAALREIQEEKGDWKGAIESQNRLIKLSGKDPEEVRKLAGMRYEWAVELLKTDRDRGIKLLKEIIRDDPDFLAAGVTLGEVHIKGGRTEEGIRVLSDGYRKHRNPVFLQVLEDNLIRSENPSRLVKLFGKLLADFPDDALLSLFFGKIYLRLEMIDESYQILKKVESRGYESPLLFALLGEANVRRDRSDEAIEDFRRSINLSDGMSPRFTCGNCGHVSEKWHAKCQSCGNWNSYALPGLSETGRRPPAVRPQYDARG